MMCAVRGMERGLSDHHAERMESDKIAKRVYVGVCAVSRSVGRPRKRWIDNVKGVFKEKRFACQSSKENGAG